jgi:hypothetical protein
VAKKWAISVITQSLLSPIGRKFAKSGHSGWAKLFGDFLISNSSGHPGPDQIRLELQHRTTSKESDAKKAAFTSTF